MSETTVIDEITDPDWLVTDTRLRQQWRSTIAQLIDRNRAEIDADRIAQLDGESCFGKYYPPTSAVIDTQAEGVDRVVYPPLSSLYNWAESLTQAFEVVAAAPDEGVRAVRGPLHKDLNQIFAETDQELKAIDPSLPPEALWPSTYMPFSVDRHIRQLASSFCKREYAERFDSAPLDFLLRRVQITKNQRLDDLVKNRLPNLSQQEIPDGALSRPDYFYWQAEPQGCSRTCFLMVMSAIADEAIHPFSLERAHKSISRDDINRLGGTSLLHDAPYLKLFETEAFRRNAGKEVSVSSFMGADLEWLASVATKVRSKIPSSEVYVVLNILSDTHFKTALHGIWHTNVLLGADSDYVYVHDPNNNTGQPNRRLPKDVFFQRWGQAQLRGHLIVSRPQDKTDVVE